MSYNYKIKNKNKYVKSDVGIIQCDHEYQLKLASFIDENPYVTYWSYGNECGLISDECEVEPDFILVMEEGGRKCVEMVMVEDEKIAKGISQSAEDEDRILLFKDRTKVLVKECRKYGWYLRYLPISTFEGEDK